MHSKYEHNGIKKLILNKWINKIKKDQFFYGINFFY